MSDVDDTPARLVAAAERLFIEGGEETTSLRAISREAISNAAAVHYHFGGRDGLLRAVLDRHLAARQDRRLRALDRVVDEHRTAAPVHAVLTALLRPDVELLAKLRKHRVNVARFLGRAHATRTPVVGDYLDRQFAAVADRAVPLLAASVPDVSSTELRSRLRLVLDAVAMLYATAADPGGPGPLGTNDVDEQVRRLVAFFAAGLAVPPSTTGSAKPGTAKRRKRS